MQPQIIHYLGCSNVAYLKKMPVIHMVWFKTKEPMTPENWAELHTAANNLKTIPGVISVELGSYTTQTVSQDLLGIHFIFKSLCRVHCIPST
jgi:hypothetical protein